MTDKFAFLTPLHPKHFGFGYQILNHHYNYGIKHFFVFSCPAEYDVFVSASNPEHNKNMIPIITNEITNLAGAITFKKWYGLHYILNHYSDRFDYIITTDAEIDFVHHNFDADHIYSRCQYIFENKKFYGGRFDTNHNRHILNVNHESLNMLRLVAEKDRQKLMTETDDLRIYLWMSDLTVYRVSDLGPFMECIQFDDCEIQNRLSYEAFDHIAYQFYCIMFIDFKVVEISSLTGYPWSLESYFTDSTEPFRKLQEEGYRISWVWHRCFNATEQLKNWLIENGVFMIYHLDR
jgi:hypothetical protein